VTEQLEQDLETKRTEIDDTLHALEDKLTIQHFTDEAKHKAGEAVGAAGDFVRRHPIPIAVALGLAVGGVSARYGFRTRRRSRTELLHDLIDRQALRELVDYDSLREMMDAAVARGTAGSQAAQRFARRTVRGIATSRPVRSLPSRSEVTRSIEGLTEGFADAAVRAGRRAANGGLAAERRVVALAQEQPMAVGLGTLALAIGAGVALALTRRSTS